jgi:hypothetical protein
VSRNDRGVLQFSSGKKKKKKKEKKKGDGHKAAAAAAGSARGSAAASPSAYANADRSSAALPGGGGGSVSPGGVAAMPWALPVGGGGGGVLDQRARPVGGGGSVQGEPPMAINALGPHGGGYPGAPLMYGPGHVPVPGSMQGMVQAMPGEKRRRKRGPPYNHVKSSGYGPGGASDTAQDEAQGENGALLAKPYYFSASSLYAGVPVFGPDGQILYYK